MRLVGKLFLVFILFGCGRNTAPQKTIEEPIDNLSVFSEGEQGESFISEEPIDTVYKKDSVFIRVPSETIYVAQKIKIKKSNNTDNSEMIKLKNAVLIRDSQIDSLNILLGKKCVGEQTNNGLAWWILILIGMALGVTGYQAIRLGITKKW